jgi:hypothetical protein
MEMDSFVKGMVIGFERSVYHPMAPVVTVG